MVCQGAEHIEHGHVVAPNAREALEEAMGVGVGVGERDGRDARLHARSVPTRPVPNALMRLGNVDWPDLTAPAQIDGYGSSLDPVIRTEQRAIDRDAWRRNSASSVRRRLPKPRHGGFLSSPPRSAYLRLMAGATGS